jgi:hypothetical protein
MGRRRRCLYRQRVHIGLQSGTILWLESYLEFLLELASMQRWLEAGPPGAEIGSTPGLLTGRVDLDMATGCPHHANQLSLGANLPAGDTGPLGNMSGLWRIALPGWLGALLSGRLRWLRYWHN